jgi:GNAT superfamily N-acetyltransferase
MIRFSISVKKTDLMPILPLANPSTKYIPLLAKLGYESYAAGTQIYSSLESATKRLQDLMAGVEGRYLRDSSFVSGSAGNYVSACLISSSTKGVATVSELFTHPLYRARGLATVEISSALNQLSRQNFSELQVWVDPKNELARRLFSKLGFTEHAQETDG